LKPASAVVDIREDNAGLSSAKTNPEQSVANMKIRIRSFK
jgi:hypothetical protein